MIKPRPRDFIETPEKLLFAVVDSQIEAGRVLGYLRYRDIAGAWVKLGSEEAQDWLLQHHPGYLFESQRLAASLHGVLLEQISRHYQPVVRAAELLGQPTSDAIENKARGCLQLFMDGGLPPASVGITGSLLVGAQHARSDLDFVLYERADFHQAQAIIRQAIEQGHFRELTTEDWRDAYARRNCELSFEEYVWHERRKFNKALIAGTKLDITLTTEAPDEADAGVRKMGQVHVETLVTDAAEAFDYPARYRLAHPGIAEAISFTQTYAGQALAGETVDIRGQLEETSAGIRRIVIGSTREAPGEFMRVIRPAGG